MKKKIMFAITIIIIVISSIIVYPYTWGERGNLSISISIDKEIINITDTINLTFSYRNEGNTNLRILHPWGKDILLFDSNNSSVEYLGSVKGLPAFSNKHLMTIRSKNSISYVWHVDYKLWDIKSNQTYRIIANYDVKNKEKITYPFWQKEIWSNEVYFSVI